MAATDTTTHEEKMALLVDNVTEIFRIGLAVCDALKSEKKYTQRLPVGDLDWMLETTHPPQRTITLTLVE